MAAAESTPDTEWQSLDARLRPEDPQPEGWYAVALADEVPTKGPIGADFLGGRVVVYRKASGEPVVMTARCPHMGADLALGDVVGDALLGEPVGDAVGAGVPGGGGNGGGNGGGDNGGSGGDGGGDGGGVHSIDTLV